MMFKYMKYEIRGTYRYMLGVLALVLILTTALYTYISRVGSTGEISAFGGTFMGNSVMILFGTALTTFLYIVGSFRKELYEDRGYLTFTLPLTGNQVVGSKLFVATLWFLALGAAIAVYNIIMALLFIPAEINLLEFFKTIFSHVSIKGTLYVVLSGVISIVNMLTLIYFSMAISRVTIRNKKIGGLWFIVFIVLSGILTYGQFKIIELLPYYIDLNTFNIGTMDTLNQQFQMEINNNIVLSTDTGMLTTNIAGAIYNIGITVALFLGTGYLIDRKIDL